jgi:hypothetical protein
MKLSRPCWLLVCLLMLAMLMNGQDAKTEQGSGSGSDVAVPSGPALAEGEVIILLQAKVPLEIIQKFVATRGVSFVSSKETSKRILAAGGNVALVGTINLNQKDEPVIPIDDNGKKKK